jgi:hypothetical protein
VSGVVHYDWTGGRGQLKERSLLETV